MMAREGQGWSRMVKDVPKYSLSRMSIITHGFSLMVQLGSRIKFKDGHRWSSVVIGGQGWSMVVKDDQR